MELCESYKYHNQRFFSIFLLCFSFFLFLVSNEKHTPRWVRTEHRHLHMALSHHHRLLQAMHKVNGKIISTCPHKTLMHIWLQLMFYQNLSIHCTQLAVGGVPPSSPFVPQQATTTHIVTTVLPIGNHPTHMICPRLVISMCSQFSFTLFSRHLLFIICESLMHRRIHFSQCLFEILTCIFCCCFLFVWFQFHFQFNTCVHTLSCHAEIQTRTRREPGLIAYVSGFIIALMGLVLDNSSL